MEDLWMILGRVFPKVNVADLWTRLVRAEHWVRPQKLLLWLETLSWFAEELAIVLSCAFLVRNGILWRFVTARETFYVRAIRAVNNIFASFLCLDKGQMLFCVILLDFLCGRTVRWARKSRDWWLKNTLAWCRALAETHSWFVWGLQIFLSLLMLFCDFSIFCNFLLKINFACGAENPHANELN